MSRDDMMTIQTKLLLAAAILLPSKAGASNNGLARTPQMGCKFKAMLLLFQVNNEYFRG